MCTNCFETEIRSFVDSSAWNKFDIELSAKLGAGFLKQIRFKPDGQRDRDDGIYIYKCASCGQKWKMKDTLYNLEGAYFRRNNVL
ncbi:MAG: hypothetical protein ACHQF2_04925 [Flavobacteriales bacterium]